MLEFNVCMVHLNVFDAAVNTESQTIQCERIRNDMHGKNDRQSTNNTNDEIQQQQQQQHPNE